jgi:chemotaxis family two-component system sensor kinase Cph1
VKQSLKAEIDSQGTLITSGPLPTIQADPVLIARLFQNLIENSIKYRSDAPPKIHISATDRPDGSWLFRARDNGVGLRPEDCERIFAPFSQVHQSDSVAGGIGLGLATCKKIVERHGGRIWAESHPGDGATFLFTIPQPVKSRPPDYADSL